MQEIVSNLKIIILFKKRALYDANTQEGVDNIVATFTFDEHKMHAARILQSVTLYFSFFL